MSDLLTELRPTSDPEFDAAWSAKFGPEADTQTGEEVVAPVTETDTETAEGQARDDQGRFVRVDAPVVDEHTRETELEREEEEQKPAAAGTDPTEDELLQKYLQKYDGDVRKALVGAIEAQKLIGRRDDEREELRARLERLEQAQQQPQPQQRVVRPITEHDVTRLDELALTNGQQAFLEARQLDPTGTLARRVLDTWGAVNPAEATLFIADQLSDAKIAQLREEFAPVLEERAVSQGDQQFVQAWTELSASRPEIEQLASVMKEVIDERPALARMIIEGDVQTKMDLLGTVADAAKAKQNPVIAEAIAQFESEQRGESRAAKTAATVTKPSSAIGSPTGGERSEKSQREKEADRIKSGILDASDTSIISGWTNE